MTRRLQASLFYFSSAIRGFDQAASLSSPLHQQKNFLTLISSRNNFCLFLLQTAQSAFDAKDSKKKGKREKDKKGKKEKKRHVNHIVAAIAFVCEQMQESNQRLSSVWKAAELLGLPFPLLSMSIEIVASASSILRLQVDQIFSQEEKKIQLWNFEAKRLQKFTQKALMGLLRNLNKKASSLNEEEKDGETGRKEEEDRNVHMKLLVQNMTEMYRSILGQKEAVEIGEAMERWTISEA